MPILEVSNVTKRFGGLFAVDNVSFTIDHRQIVGLIGPNGSGKTTLFNCITGFSPATNGEVVFEGQDITRFAPDVTCKLGIGRTFQLVRIFKDMTVLDNIKIGSFCRESNPKMVTSKSLELLDVVGLMEKKNHLASNLTVADKKRLELARILATDPKLIMLDEVMQGLTPTEIQEAIKLIKKINENGITIFLVEHVMEIVMSLSQRVIVLNSGKKIAEGSPKEVANNENVIRVYLGDKSDVGSRRDPSIV